MTECAISYVESAERLCATLERIGDALVDLDTATLLDTEETLGQLVAALSFDGSSEPSTDLEKLVRRARAAVDRCRRLGAAHSGITRFRLQLCVGTDRYDRSGGHVEPPVAQSLKASA